MRVRPKEAWRALSVSLSLRRGGSCRCQARLRRLSDGQSEYRRGGALVGRPRNREYRLAYSEIARLKRAISRPAGQCQKNAPECSISSWVFGYSPGRRCPCAADQKPPRRAAPGGRQAHRSPKTIPRLHITSVLARRGGLQAGLIR